MDTPETPQQQPLELTQLENRLDGIRQATERSRLALFICLLAAGAMLICLWNTYASWDRDFAFLDDGDFGGIEAFKPAHQDEKEVTAINAIESKIEESNKQIDQESLLAAADNHPLKD